MFVAKLVVGAVKMDTEGEKEKSAVYTCPRHCWTTSSSELSLCRVYAVMQTLGTNPSVAIH